MHLKNILNMLNFEQPLLQSSVWHDPSSYQYDDLLQFFKFPKEYKEKQVSSWYLNEI